MSLVGVRIKCQGHRPPEPHVGTDPVLEDLSWPALAPYEDPDMDLVSRTPLNGGQAEYGTSAR